MTKQIAWNTGTGNLTLEYNGSGNGQIVVVSDDNDLFSARSQTININGGGVTRQVTINQAAAPYRLVEWVENTNSNVLNFSDIIPDDANWEFYGKVAPVSFNSAWEYIFRAYTGETSNSYRIIRYNQENVSLYVNANQQANKGNKISNCVEVGTPFDFHLRSGKVTINGTDYTLSTTQGTTLTTALQISRGRWYGFTIYHNGVMVRSYHPCVDANGKYGLVDVLTGTIKYPTSGSFNSGGEPLYINFKEAERKKILTKDGYFLNVAEL